MVLLRISKESHFKVFFSFEVVKRKPFELVGGYSLPIYLLMYYFPTVFSFFLFFSLVAKMR